MIKTCILGLVIKSVFVVRCTRSCPKIFWKQNYGICFSCTACLVIIFRFGRRNFQECAICTSSIHRGRTKWGCFRLISFDVPLSDAKDSTNHEELQFEKRYATMLTSVVSTHPFILIAPCVGNIDI